MSRFESDYGAEYSPDVFAQQERDRYTETLKQLLRKLDEATQNFPEVRQERDYIEYNNKIPANQFEKYLLCPIEELAEFIDQIDIDKTNIGIVLALRDALLEKYNNLISSKKS